MFLSFPKRTLWLLNYLSAHWLAFQEQLLSFNPAENLGFFDFSEFKADFAWVNPVSPNEGFHVLINV
jgi:hypothetical protein